MITLGYPDSATPAPWLLLPAALSARVASRCQGNMRELEVDALP